MSAREIRPGDAPVVSALDEVEKLPGFEPHHIEWYAFRFQGERAGYQMDTASIFAYPSTSGRSEFVRFAVTGHGFTMTDPERRQLTASGMARALSVPTASAEKAATALGAALTAALANFSTAHACRTASRSTRRPRRVPDGHARPAGPG